eukprot:s5241_g3.t1
MEGNLPPLRLPRHPRQFSFNCVRSSLTVLMSTLAIVMSLLLRRRYPCGLACVGFVVQRHLLPGPYFYLPNILLDAALWEETPAIPIGPAGGYFCAVGETGHRRVPVETSTPLIDRRELAAWFGFDPATMLTQPAVPVIADVSINGFFCRNVCAVSEPLDPATGEPAEGLLLAFIDCRALLQGWTLLATTTGYVSRREVEFLLTTFMPGGWSLHLEGLPAQAEQCPVAPGQVITASFVPAESEESAEEGDEPEDRGDNDIAIEDVPMIGDDFLSSPRSADRAIDSATSDSTQRSRSPHRSPVDCLSHSAGPVRLGGTPWGVLSSPWFHVSSAIQLLLASSHSLRSKRTVSDTHVGRISGTTSGGLSSDLFVSGQHTGQGLFSEGSVAAGLGLTGLVRHGPGQDRPTNDVRSDDPAIEPPAAPLAVAESSGGGIASEGLDIADAGNAGSHQETLSSPSFLYGSFYLLGQDCIAEWMAVRLPLAVSVADATPLIQAARYPHQAERFPSLVPVRPQPWQQAALCVAMPVWEFAGVLVAFDLSGIDGGVFSLAVPGRVTRRTLLLAAELDEYANHAVFVRTMPWPVPEGFPIELTHGDLIQIVPAGVIATFRSDLAAMLRTADGWDPDWLIPGDYAERAWVIADDRHLCFTVAPTRRRHFKQDLAEVLAASMYMPFGIDEVQKVYTDGSYNGDTSSWSFVAVGHTAASTVFLGWAGGLVLIEQGPFWIGADSHSVLHGESSALFWAIAWTLQFGDSVPCTIWTDSTTASGQASGKFGAAANATLAHACRSLGYVAEAIGGVKVQDFCHVRAHQGHAWNEVADALAKHSHWFATVIPSVFATFTLWIADASLEWMQCVC